MVGWVSGWGVSGLEEGGGYGHAAGGQINQLWAPTSLPKRPLIIKAPPRLLSS